MNEDLVTAVKQLVDAVCTEHCTDQPNGDDPDPMMRTVECVSVVVEKIRTAPELSSLHSWAESTARLMPGWAVSDGGR
jgi:hypothetical protein